MYTQGRPQNATAPARFLRGSSPEGCNGRCTRGLDAFGRICLTRFLDMCVMNSVLESQYAGGVHRGIGNSMGKFLLEYSERALRGCAGWLLVSSLALNSRETISGDHLEVSLVELVRGSMHR